MRKAGKNACFVVVAAGIFAIYSVYKKRKARQNNNITTPAAISPPVIAKGNGMDQFPKADVADSINNRGNSKEASDICDRIAIIDRGKLVALNSTQELLKNNLQ